MTARRIGRDHLAGAEWALHLINTRTLSHSAKEHMKRPVDVEM